MLHTLCNKKGVTLVEVILAIFLTAIGIMALLSLHSTGWKAMAKSDYVGRASGILYKTLENYETLILNPCYTPANDPTAGNILNTNLTASVCVSGNSSAISGDICYTVTTFISQVSATGVNPRVYLITVTVTWPANLPALQRT